MGDKRNSDHVFFIPSMERLWGYVNGEAFNFKAFSGGGRGSKNPKVWQNSVSSWLPETDTLKGKQRGGPLPPGIYTIEKPMFHPKFGEWNSFLNPKFVSPKFSHRDGFFIHGPGSRGSDGCIVLDGPELILFLKAVKNSQKTVLLKVARGFAMPPSFGEKPMSIIA